MLFLPRELSSRRACEALFERIIDEYDMKVLGGDVPTNNQFVGATPKLSEPRIRQAFVGMDDHFYNRADFDRRMYVVAVAWRT